MAIVLSKIIGIGVGDSTVGPAVLEINNELLKHLKKSAEKEKTYDQSSSAPKQQLQGGPTGLGRKTQLSYEFMIMKITVN